MQLELDPSEIQFIYNVLSELPTKSGAYPLTVKIKEQAEAQVPVEKVVEAE